MIPVPKRAIAIAPHAEDIPLFAGGTLANWIAAGSEIMVVRATQDEKDSYELCVEDTIATNHREFEKAMAELGVTHVKHLNYRDCELLDVPHGELRERLIRFVREFKPEIVVTFDPMVTDEQTPDHMVVGRAASDAAWAAAYPNFHPEHLEQGLSTHCTRGCLFFTKHFTHGETLVDISSGLDKKIATVTCLRNMLRSMLANQKQRVQSADLKIPVLERTGLDDYAHYWEMIVTGAAMLSAQDSNLEYAERFRSTLLTKDDMLIQFLYSQG